MNNKTMGRLIADRRKTLNMTQKQLADRLGVTDRAVSRWERGVGAPEISLLLPLATVLEITTDELLGTPSPTAEPVAPAYIPTRTGIPLFYHYLRSTIFLGGWLVMVVGIVLGSNLHSLSLLITLATIGLVIMIASTIFSCLMFRCPVCGHSLWTFNPRLSQYTTQYCRTCGKSMYSDKTVRTLKEYLNYKKEADAR